MAVFLFDLDGTLIDSGADLAVAVNLTRAAFGLPPQPESFVISCIGDGMRQLLERSIPELSDRVEELFEVQRNNYKAHCLDRTRLYPTVRETLETMRARGDRLAVVTNKPTDRSIQILEGLGVLSMFDAVVGGGDCEELKPSPKPLLLAAERMGVPLTRQDWMVGDNWTDLGAGEAAGVRRCFCTFGMGKQGKETFEKSIAQFSDLLQL